MGHSGNFPIVWVCVLWICVAYSAPVAAASQSSWSILSVKVLSLMRCPWASLEPSTTCCSNGHNILSAPSTCWESQVSSVVHCSPQCVFTGYLFTGSVKPLRLSPRTTVTSSVKKKRPTTSRCCSYFGRLIFQYASFNNSVLFTSSRQHVLVIGGLVHCTVWLP